MTAGDIHRLIEWRKSVEHRLGTLWIEIYGSGQNLLSRVSQAEIIVKDLRDLESAALKAAEEVGDQERRLDALELWQCEERRKPHNEELRRFVDFLNLVPGGLRSVGILLILLIAVIDLVIDVLGWAEILKRMIG